MPYRTIEGRVTYFTEPGRCETVMLLHAGGTSSAHWRKVAPLLQDRFRLVAPDMIGFGETGAWRGAGEMTHDDQAALVRGVADAVTDGPVHLVGHSYGGAVAVRYALRYPEAVASMVLIEPVLTPLLPQVGEDALFAAERDLATAFIRDAEAGRSVSAWRRFIDHHNGDGTWESLSGNARHRFLGMTRETADAYRSNLNNPTTLPDLCGIGIPARVVHGGRTTETYRRICRILCEHLPRATGLEIAEAAHMSPLTHPAEVAAAIRAHVAETSSAASAPAFDARDAA